MRFIESPNLLGTQAERGTSPSGVFSENRFVQRVGIETQTFSFLRQQVLVEFE